MRSAWIAPEPTPLRSTESAPSAAFIAVGIERPVPKPIAVIQAATKP